MAADCASRTMAHDAITCLVTVPGAHVTCDDGQLNFLVTQSSLIMLTFYGTTIEMGMITISN